ncbi:PREDICTED: uncharacterized protein LOC105450122 isoform X2 [Wasmannia auropunctata]|uniref:uncharacterized protein LOC105450122 isoform X2 n=1 Tax=Wasmannia auropunctata TaxID=64793 RepID=UPI0005F0BA8C|nr:PREDICTED: uncharacterized protein LOC105450122 isoform X2 [Wasmannia auropunctata]
MRIKFSASKMSKISLKTSSTQFSLQHINLPTSKRKSDYLSDTSREKWPKKNSRLKPFGFCCSVDRFDPLSRYDQRMPPYKSSLTAITSVHECPVAKMQMKFSMPRLSREKKRPKTRTSDVGDQQRQTKNRELSYSLIGRNNRFIKRYLESEIALAKDIFWKERQKMYKETSNKAIKIAKKKHKKHSLKLKMYPRWYQDFSLDQMRNLMKLENVMRTDYEEKKTNDTQTTLIAIGVISTFFKLKPSTIKELHKLCNLNSVDFLREIYRILTGNDFSEEGYKKVYDCNERIILSAIAFLTLPETVWELHKRLPAVTMPSLPPKPKLVTYLTRRKDSCPYKEELFTRPDWAGYRNALQKWRKHCKLIAIPKVILPLNKYGYVNEYFFNDRSEIKKRTKDISTEHLEEITTKELQKISLITCDQEDSSKEKNLEGGKSASFNILQSSDNGKTSDFIKKKSETVENKIYGPPKPPAGQNSWLGKKDADYMIAGVSIEDDCPVTYEIAGVVNVAPSNSNERFFAVLKLDDQTKKVFPSGRENLSMNWQDWLQNADESYRQLEEETDELIKSVQATIKSAFPGLVCDSCCSCRQTKKFDEKLQQSKINKMLIAQDKEKNTHIADSMAVQSLGQNPSKSLINQVASVPQPIKNVPPCSCAIRQMADKDISPSTSKEDITWTKDEELCPGKQYRPNEPGAYSCKAYPGDKFCRHNPFIKEIIKMERRKIEKQKEEKEVKEKTESIEAIKENTTVSQKDITEKKKDKFITDSDYSAYHNPWNIARTAPSATDYEANLKLTPPAWPTRSPLKMQNDIFSLQESKKIKNDALDKKSNDKEFLKSSKNSPKEMSEEKKRTKDIKNEKKEPISLKKITNNKKKLSSTISRSTTISKTINKQPIKSLLPNNPTKRPNKINKVTKHSSVKKTRNKNIVDQTEVIENRKRELTRLKNKFKSSAGILDDIQPAILPEKLSAISHNPEEKISHNPAISHNPEKKISHNPAISHNPEKKISHNPAISHNPEKKIENIVDFAADDEEERYKIKNGPCGWKTKSEQELAGKKTLAYLCEPDYPLEMMAVRLEGRPCQCKENREKKKILMYNVGGLVERKIGGRKDLMDFKSPEERRNTALKDTALINYFTQRDDNAPCRTSCRKFARSARPCRLKVVKPVCECKYKRKIVEQNEEKTKWKDCQRRLKTFKKQSFTHIADISRPMIEDKQFIIADVKRTPREDEKDDVKYYISGVAEDISMLPSQKIIDGLKMSTPFQTPLSSEEDISPTAALHRHWSPMNIPPGPLPRKDAALKEEMERRKRVRDEAFKLIYEDKNEQDASLTTRNGQEAFDEHKLTKNIDKRKDNIKDNHTSIIKKGTSTEIMRLQSLNKKTGSKIVHERGANKEITDKVIRENKYSEEIVDHQKNVSYKQMIERTEEKIDNESHRIKGGADKKYINNKSDLKTIMKAELKKMAAEGYTFAKLPKCHLMPQLQDWLMYREGVVFSETDKKNLMQATCAIWELINKRAHIVEKPSLHMTIHQLKMLTYNQAEKIKEKIENVRATFHSNVRKTRVSYARMMWNTMEQGKFPSVSFKRTFFTYMASKEADGHVYKPWLTSEEHERDVDFCC